MTALLESYGPDRYGQEIYLLELGSWTAWPTRLELPSSHFRLLLAADASAVAAPTIGILADAALSAGCAYVCAWGRDCERVHDVFDNRDAERGADNNAAAGPVVMSTWHENETLKVAISFLLKSAWPDAAFAETCKASVVTVIAAKQIAGEARRLLRDRGDPTTEGASRRR